jgi:hypothetical protein
MIDTAFRTPFQNRLSLIDFTRMIWAAFRACLEDRLSGNSVINDEEARKKRVEELTSSICSQELTTW